MATAKEVDDTLTDQEKRCIAGFLLAISRIVDNAVIDDLVPMAERGDFEGVARMLGIDELAMTPLVESIRDALKAGGDLEPIRRAGRVVAQFNIRSPSAEQWLQRLSNELVVEITQDQRDAIRTILADAIRSGRNPRAAIVDLVGHSTQQGRVGGVIGLTNRQAQWVLNARAELESLDASYFTRALRDRRFDSTVRAAIENEKPLTQTQIDRIMLRYKARMLAHRADVLGRTEAHNALEAGRFLTYEQAVADGKIKQKNIKRYWINAHDSRVRFLHRNVDMVHGTDAPFVLQDGARLRYPGDTSLGAGGVDTINCRCFQRLKVDWLAEVLG